MKYRLNPIEPFYPIFYSEELKKIQSDLNFTLEETTSFISDLSFQGHIVYEQADEIEDNYYHITPKGRVAYSDKFYLKELWYYSRDFWVAVSAILISVISLIVSIWKD